MRYVLTHGVKEDLVERLRDWPGVSAVRALLDGEPLEGLWFDRTQEHRARRQDKAFERLEFATSYTVQLEPLPCWAHLSAEEYRRRVAEEVEVIESQAARKRELLALAARGAAAIREQEPHTAPERLKKSPAPRFHAATKRIRRELYEGYRHFFAAFRDAAARLRAGEIGVVFPAGSFPPAVPWVAG
jgi:hypothetical protein